MDIASLVRRGERHGLALVPRPAGAADPVHIVCGAVGKVVVQDKLDTFHVNAARGDVSGHEHTVLPSLKSRERTPPLRE